METISRTLPDFSSSFDKPVNELTMDTSNVWITVPLPNLSTEEAATLFERFREANRNSPLIALHASLWTQVLENDQRIYSLRISFRRNF